MSEIELKLCRICLKSGEDVVFSGTPTINNFFHQVIGVQDLSIKTWLCAWCKTAVKKAINLIELATSSQETLKEYQQDSKDIGVNLQYRSPYKLSHCSNIDHVDIMPSKETKNAVPVNIGKEGQILLPLHEILFYEDSEDSIVTHTEEDKETRKFRKDISKITQENVPDSSENTDSINIDKEDSIEKKIKRKKSKKRIKEKSAKKNALVTKFKGKKKVLNCKEMMFEYKILDINEQLKDIEEKKMSEKYTSMSYHCEDCGIGFLTSDIHEEHLLRHKESSGSFECETCHLRFKSNDVLYQHSAAHKRRFTCMLCGGMFRRWSHCLEHRYKCGTVPTPVRCSHCKKVFSDLNSLKIHIRGVHKNEGKFACEKCSKRFSRKEQLTVHMRVHTGVRPFACEQCNRRFTTNSNLRAHRQVHRDTKNYYCVECDTYYSSQKNLRSHLRNSMKHASSILMPPHALKPFACDECPRRFTTNSRLRAHRLSHNIPPKTHCAECDVHFKTEKGLKNHFVKSYRHVGRSNETATFTCPECSKQFSLERTMKAHISTVHTKSTTYMCSLCTKAFSTTINLKKHMFRIHIKEEKKE